MMSESSTQASGAQSYRNRKVEAVYKQHEEKKKNKYLRHVLETEKCSFTPLVFSTHGMVGVPLKLTSSTSK